MENGEAANEGSATSVEEQMLEALSENEESQSSAADSDTVEVDEPKAQDGSDAEEVEAQDEQEEEAEAKADAEDETVPKRAFTKRINGLQAAKRKAEGRTTELENKLSQYDVVLLEMKDRLEAAEQKLVDHDENDPRDAEIRQLKLGQRLQALQQKQQKESHQVFMKQQQEELVSQRADEIIDTAKGLSDKYNTFSSEELVIAFSKTDSIPMEKLANTLHQTRLKQYKKHLAKDRTHAAPAPLRPQGARIQSSGHGSDDMVRFLESLHGEK